MATEVQINYLKNLGYAGPTTTLTNQEASALIKKLIAEKKNGTAQQQPQQYNNYSNYGAPQQAPQQPQPQQYNNYSGYNQAPTSTKAPVQRQDVLPAKSFGVETDDLMNSLNDMANDGMLFIPENYSVGNALKSALSKILTSDQCDKLLACTPESKKQALTEYIVQGLDASKTQCYFIPYGNKMTMMRSYFGDVAVVKRTGLVKDVYAVVIYDGDEIEIGFDEYGRKTLVKHTTKFENMDNEIKGAYAVVVGINGYKAYEFMTRNELEKSWKMSKMPNGKLHTDYKQEAAKRTVIRRAVKTIFNTSLNTTEEQTALIGSYNRTTVDEYEDSTNEETKYKTTDQVKEQQKKITASKKVTPISEEEFPE